MKTEQPTIEQVFSQTTVQAEEVREFLLEPELGHVEYVIAKGHSKYIVDLARITERFEIQVRAHLAGTPDAEEKMGEVFTEITTKFPLHAEGSMLTVLLNLQKEIMKRQWYEFVTPLKALAERITANLKLRAAIKRGKL